MFIFFGISKFDLIYTNDQKGQSYFHYLCRKSIFWPDNLYSGPYFELLHSAHFLSGFIVNPLWQPVFLHAFYESLKTFEYANIGYSNLFKMILDESRRW